jgi:hypothetical protein
MDGQIDPENKELANGSLSGNFMALPEPPPGKDQDTDDGQPPTNLLKELPSSRRNSLLPIDPSKNRSAHNLRQEQKQLVTEKTLRKQRMSSTTRNLKFVSAIAQVSDGQMLAHLIIASSVKLPAIVTRSLIPQFGTIPVVGNHSSKISSPATMPSHGESLAIPAQSTAVSTYMYVGEEDLDPTFEPGIMTTNWGRSGTIALNTLLLKNILQSLGLQTANLSQSIGVDFNTSGVVPRVLNLPSDTAGQGYVTPVLDLGQNLSMFLRENHTPDAPIPSQLNLPKVDILPITLRMPKTLIDIGYVVMPVIESPIDRPQEQPTTITQPIDRPVEKPIGPVDRPTEVPTIPVEVPIDQPVEIDSPKLPLDRPIVPIEVKPDLPVEIPVEQPIKVDLIDKDCHTPVVITKGVIEISGFTGVGRGTSPSIDRLAEVDTLQFVGSGMIAKYLQLEQKGQDVIVSFEGNDLVKVRLKNVALDELDNLDRLTGASTTVGNILFDGDLTTKDSFDVFNSDWYRNTLLNTNTTTFLNDLDNFVYGFDNSDDVINGQGGNDILFGEGGNDILRGGAGNDILNGGLGQNQLVGGSGCDTFVITPNGSSDVMDFIFGEDKIQLAQGSTYGQLTLTNFTEGNRGGTQILQNNQLVLRVFGVTATQLTTDQFVPWQGHRLP